MRFLAEEVGPEALGSDDGVRRWIAELALRNPEVVGRLREVPASFRSAVVRERDAGRSRS